MRKVWETRRYALSGTYVPDDSVLKRVLELLAYVLGKAHVSHD